MKVKEIAGLAEVSPDTVRFYSRKGLLQPRQSSHNGFYSYSSEDLNRLRFIRKARQLGLSLNEIGNILSQTMEDSAPCPEVKEIFTNRLSDLERELQELQHLHDRMWEVVEAWRVMPGGAPYGHTIRRLIKQWSDPA